MERRAKFVTEAREKLGLDPVCRLRLFARRLLSLEGELELARSLRDTGVERAIQREHTILGLPPRGRVVKQPAQRLFPLGARGQRRHGCLDGNYSSVPCLDPQRPFVEPRRSSKSGEVCPELAASLGIDEGSERLVDEICTGY